MHHDQHHPSQWRGHNDHYLNRNLDHFSRTA
jgi:hypothetical protein